MPTTAIDFKNQLNPDQYAAVVHGEGPQLVIAGAGSGKTRVITYRIAWLIRECGVDPWQITAVTFTNKAAGEMRERVEELVARYPLDTFVGTFHRYALRLLRRYGERVGLRHDFVILDSRDQQELIKKALKKEEVDESAFRPQAVLAAISGAKNKLLGPAEYERRANDYFRRKVASIYKRYQAAVRQASGVDFDDMISLTVKLLESDSELCERIRQRARYLLVDEFQDTNHAQLRLISLLAGKDGNLMAVGDEDQGIYRWRGAELSNILHFENKFSDPRIYKLERNYRSTQNILDASGALIANNRGRRGKKLWTDAGAGDKIALYRAADERDEARWLTGTLSALQPKFKLEHMAILVRTNAQTRALEDELLRRRMPYTLVGGVRFYERAEIKDLISYLRLLRNLHDPHSLGRILNRPARGIGKTTQDRLYDHAEASERSPWQLLLDEDLPGIAARSKNALLKFRDMILQLAEETDGLPLAALLRQVIEATGYSEQFAKRDADSQARLENIQEFVSAAQEFTEANAYGSDDDDLLTAFLDQVSLSSDLDNLQQERGVSLMTLHSAKGLEFAVCAVSGLEEGLLPHFNAQASDEDLEEERRLLYVGMTRAEKRLVLTACRRRRIAGRYQDQNESPFLAEIPEEFLDQELSRELDHRENNSAVYDFFSHSAGGRTSSATAAGRRASRTPSSAPRPMVSSFDPDEADHASGQIRRGSRVRHAHLGPGQVMHLEGSGDDLRVIVLFETVGRRKLIARYANLEVVRR